MTRRSLGSPAIRASDKGDARRFASGSTVPLSHCLRPTQARTAARRYPQASFGCAALAMAESEESARSRLLSFAQRPRVEPPDMAAFDAAVVPALARQAAQLVWARRVANERLSVGVARRIRATVEQAGVVDSAIDAALERLEADEVAHVELATTMLNRLGATTSVGSDAAPPAPPGDAAESLFRQVLTALCVCEVVSAVRFASVRPHTDLPLPRACIELMLRDEATHGELGFALLPLAVARLVAEVGRDRVAVIAGDELRTALRELDRVVGLDAGRRGGLGPARPQPTPNPGVVEPAVDAAAFYTAVERVIVPRLERAGLPALAAWRERWA